LAARVGMQGWMKPLAYVTMSFNYRGVAGDNRAMSTYRATPGFPA
jgi:hypothetical protein